MDKQTYYKEKAEHDFLEDQRYLSEKELEQNIQYAVKNGHLSEELGEDLLKDKEKGFKWLFEGRIL